MLINIRYIKNNISVLLNGEQVISIDFIEEELSFPTASDQDWLGFYAYEDVHPISIDSFAIYSYSVPVEVAKRRWVWGQGVVAPETTNSALNATTAFSDYSFTKYAVNYNYPDFANWKQGFFSNIVTSSNVLSLPNYDLPEISTGSLSLVDWYDELKTEESLVTDKYYSFRPSVPSLEQAYIYFKNFDLLNEPVQSFYCIMESDGTAVNEPLVKIINSITKDSLLIKLNGTLIEYILTINGVPAIIQSKTISANQMFAIGINLNNFSNIYEPSITLSGIQKFFSNQDALSLYVAGDSVTTFSGKIYRIGFDGAYNNRKINTLYNSNGIFDTENATQLIDHIANYTLKAYEKYGIFFLDIASSGYWEDYMPLSYFGKYVTEYDGKSYYDLDLLQINVDYPESLSTTAIETTSSWTYSDLFTRYSNPVQQTYANFDNFIYSGWENYEDVSQDSEKYFYYNTQNNSVRSYISFQKISEGANKTLVDYQYKAVARSKNVIDPNTLTDIDPTIGVIPNNWENRAFELVDGTVVYPPKTYLNNNTVNFNDLAIVYHLDFTSEGLKHHPVRFRELQIASQVLERQKFTEVGTRFGTSVYPYTKTGFYYDFKGKNPLAVYKGSTPYLYNNRHSGWRMVGDFNTLVERGISVPVNVQKGLNTQISSMQIWGRFSEKYFPQSETMFMSVDYKNGIYDFYFIADESTQRGKIFAKDRSTNAIVNSIEYHINGQFVGTPFIVNEEWFVLGIAFTELLDFDQYTGRINLNGPLTYNNVSYYLATNLEQEQRVETRSWGQVKNNGSPVIWDYWQNSFTWSEVKVISTSNVYSIDPSDIYKKYVGSDRIIIDDSVEGILLDPEKLKIYGDISWSTSTKIPV